MQEYSLINWFINHLPFELHLPGYNFCGPGTKLRQRLARGDKGINLLDEYCKQHDIAYSKSKSILDRHKADIVLMKLARERALAPEATMNEKIASNLVSKAMLAKVASGAGLKNNKHVKSSSGTELKKHLKHIISHTKRHMKKLKPKCKKMAIKLAIAAAKDLATNSTIKLP